MTLPGGLSLAEVVVAVHLLVSLMVYVPSAAAALLRRWRPLRAEVAPEDSAVTVLRPMRGIDPQLEENLASFARLEAHPSFEVLMLLDDAADEALPLARRLEARHPGRFKVVIGTTPGLSNPKVASLVHGLQHARNRMIWVTDSNTETSQEHFQAHLTAWRYTQRYGKTPALVHAPTAAIDGSGLGAVFERLQMTGYNNVSAETTLIVGIDTVVGKSLLFHRDDLAAVGGLASFGAMANEDFLMGVAFRKLGAVQLANRATQQVLGEVSVTDFWRRQARWAATRKQTSTGSFYLLEHFTYFGLLWVWLALGLLSWQVVAAVFAFKMVVDGLVQAAWSSRRSLLDPLLVPAKDLVLLAAWSSAIFMRGFSWRGRDLAVNREGNYRDAIPASVEASSVSEPQ